MQRWEQQCYRWRCPLLALTAKDAAPEQPSVWALLVSRGKDILEVVEDIATASINWPQHLITLVPRPFDARAPWWPRPKAGEGWSPQHYKLRQVPIQGQSTLLWPSTGLFLVSSSAAVIRNQQVGRNNNPAAAWMQHYMSQVSPVLRPHTEPGMSLYFPKRQKVRDCVHSKGARTLYIYQILFLIYLQMIHILLYINIVLVLWNIVHYIPIKIYY